MKKLFISLMSIIVLLGCNLFSSSTSTDYVSAEYTSTQDIAQPGQETKVELEDGAAIVIPANAVESEVSVKVERNPEKANNLPPLDDGVVKVGDFYNFEVDGTLNGYVDLILPFDPDSVPESKAGVLVVAIPTKNGWKYIPVIPDGNKVTLYTDEVGDPLIAWHFSCVKDRIDLSYEGHVDTSCEDQQAKLLACDPDIALDVIQNGDKFEVVGSVIPVSKNFFGIALSAPAANVKVTLNLNLRESGSGQKFSVQTDENGSFSYELDSTQLKEGWNWVFAKAECDPWWGQIAVESKGYAEFKYTPAIVEQPASTPTSQSNETPIATVIPEPAETAIPAGAVLLPDFVGQPIDDAIDWLESNGFKYTWIDGSSTYDLGMVYSQAPASNQYKVPHRTVIVLYRTINKIVDPCAGLNLTAEECPHNGTHVYQRSCTVIKRPDGCSCGDGTTSRIDITELSMSFTDNHILTVEENNTTFSYEKIDTNTYKGSWNDYSMILTFTDQGFIEIDERGPCAWENEYKINK